MSGKARPSEGGISDDEERDTISELKPFGSRMKRHPACHASVPRNENPSGDVRGNLAQLAEILPKGVFKQILEGLDTQPRETLALISQMNTQ